MADLVYYWPATHGGIAEYANCQVQALSALGVDVDVLCSPGFKFLDNHKLDCKPILREQPDTNWRRIRQLGYAYQIVQNSKKLFRYTKVCKARAILFASFPCFMTPLWKHRIAKLQSSGIKIGAMLHDPDLSYVVGPKWFNDKSINDAFGMIDVAFAHSPIDPSTYVDQPNFRIEVVPHGPYQTSGQPIPQQVAREKYGLGAASFVVLIFGHLRANKNIDFVIRAVAKVRQETGLIVNLIVAGNEPGGANQSAQVYVDLVQELGLESQCQFHVRFIEDHEIGVLLSACDAVALTYNDTFCSASGVLNLVARFNKPILASSGEGSLKHSLMSYQLGVWVNPDSVDAIAAGLTELVTKPIQNLEWERYENENTWRQNAETVAKSLGVIGGAK